MAEKVVRPWPDRPDRRLYGPAVTYVVITAGSNVLAVYCRRTGTVQVRNWKPVSCDVITDDPSATVDDMLDPQLAALITLKIRLRR